MTDGIIQKLFQKYLVTHDKQFSDLFTTNEIKSLQQELIEKIKQMKCYYGLGDQPYINRNKLIGDNQE